MQILAVDVGTGTQDVLLFDTDREPENALKLVMPSPTVLVAQAIRAATQRGERILLTGVTMGGGPCAWAAEAHLKAGYPVFATPAAARTFDDDLQQVVATGIHLVAEDEAAAMTGMTRLAMADFDYGTLHRTFGAFGVDLERADLLAVAAFDHGAAPPGISDRLFRFEYLAERIQTGDGLASFAYPRDAIPPSMTRLQAVATSSPPGRPLLVMDTAPAAVLGTLEDPVVRAHDTSLVANIGNFHTLAFRLQRGAVTGLFEHHTGLLDRTRLEDLLLSLAAGTLSHERIFAEHGHGALLLDPTPSEPGFLAVTGPRRRLLAGSPLKPYLAVPHGDMMMAGCWGLIRAVSQVMPWTTEAIESALGVP